MDKQGLLFHIETGDYFITLATVLNFFAEEMEKVNRSKKYKEEDFIYLERSLKEARDELIFLQKNFQIVRKALNVSSLLKNNKKKLF